MTRPGLLAVDQLEGGGWTVVEILAEPPAGGGHLPGAVATTLHRSFALQRPGRNLDYDLPSAEEFAAEMARLGLTPGANVVFADEGMNRWATRAYWLCRYYGHAGEVRVLDGGLPAARAAGLATAGAPSAATPAAYPTPAVAEPRLRVTADELAAAIRAGTVTACDVRTTAEYTGATAMSGRAGHLPGAIHVEWARCLTPDGRFLDDAGLRRVLAPYLEGGGELVTYCQGGIRASLTWFALDVLLGRPAQLYAGSWEDWAQRPDLPAEVSVT